MPLSVQNIRSQFFREQRLNRIDETRLLLVESFVLIIFVINLIEKKDPAPELVEKYHNLIQGYSK